MNCRIQGGWMILSIGSQVLFVTKASLYLRSFIVKLMMLSGIEFEL